MSGIDQNQDIELTDSPIANRTRNITQRKQRNRSPTKQPTERSDPDLELEDKDFHTPVADPTTTYPHLNPYSPHTRKLLQPPLYGFGQSVSQGPLESSPLTSSKSNIENFGNTSMDNTSADSYLAQIAAHPIATLPEDQVNTGTAGTPWEIGNKHYLYYWV